MTSAMKNLKQIHSSFWFFFSGAVFVFGLFYLASYPGIFSGDIFFLLEDLSKGFLNDWSGYFYCLVVSFAQFLTPNIASLGVFQVLAVSTIAASGFAFFYARGVNKILLIALYSLFILSPLNIGSVNFYDRDTLFGIFNLGLILFGYYLLFRKVHLKIEASAKELIGFFSLMTVVTLLRQDALPLYFVSSFFLVFFLRPKKSLRNKTLAGLFISFIIFSFVLPKVLKVTESSGTHLLTTTVNPLSYIIVNTNEDITEEEKTAIDHAISYRGLIDDYSEYEIEPFHKHGVQWQNSEQLTSYFKAYFAIIFRNLDLYYKNRISMFMATIGIYGPSSHFLDSNGTRFVKERFHNNSIYPQSQFPQLKAKLYRSLFQSMQIWKGLFGGCVLQILLFISLFCFFKSLPVTTGAMSLVIYRLPLVFFLSPASQFKYVYDFYLTGFFILPMLLLEISAKKTYNKTQDAHS